MPARFHVALPLLADQSLSLPGQAARHVQVLRLQPGDLLNLFDGSGAEWSARIVRMGRSDVEVRVESAVDPLPGLRCAVTLAIGMPANERMDSLVEKATELGVATVQPLMCERSVLRLQGDRAQKKRAHWQAIAVSASEQSGRATVPAVAEVATLSAWLAGIVQPASGETADPPWRGLLSLRRDALPLARALGGPQRFARVVLLSGPEGGLTQPEEGLAMRAGFAPISLGRRVLRADTAPLAAMAGISLLGED